MEQTDSTNDYCKKLSTVLKKDAVVIALRQTAGRGRKTKSFFSPDGGIYLSLLLHPKNADINPADITVAAAVAVFDAIKVTLGLNTAIKWVNDIYLGDKKCCGILTEGGFNSLKGEYDYIIVGIGINLVAPKDGFPPEISGIACSLCETADADTYSSLIENTVLLLTKNIADTDKSYIEKYRKNSWLDGKNITFIKENREQTGRVLGIDENCELIVKLNDSNNLKLKTGEVSIKKL